MKILQEFKDFTLRGNVLDLAVGVVIGAAFSAIVNAVVDSLLMPIVGMLTGGVDFKSLAVKVGSAELKYGMFIQAIVTFVIIAFFLFLVVKAANMVKLKTPIAPPSKSESLLGLIHEELVEIRRRVRVNATENKDAAKSGELVLEQ